MRDIDVVTHALCARYPGLTVSQLDVRHLSPDDRGVWFVRHPASPFEVRLQASAGSFPLELASDADTSRTLITMTDTAIDVVAEKLGLIGQSASLGDES